MLSTNLEIGRSATTITTAAVHKFLITLSIVHANSCNTVAAAGRDLEVFSCLAKEKKTHVDYITNIFKDNTEA